MAAGGVILLAIFAKRGSNTEITTSADQLHRELVVTIDGKHRLEYEIILRKDGDIYGEAVKKESVTFRDLQGTYTLDVKFKGKGKLPKVNAYQRTFSFSAPPEAPQAPQISNIVQNPKKLTKLSQTYTVTIETDVNTVPLSETEFSADGNHWQQSATFHNLQAGTYTFMARHTQDNDLLDNKTILLEAFVPAPAPTQAQLNKLLSGIAARNQNDLNTFIQILGGNTPVKGFSGVSDVTALANDVFIQQQPVKVTHISTNNGVVVGITVQ